MRVVRYPVRFAQAEHSLPNNQCVAKLIMDWYSNGAKKALVTGACTIHSRPSLLSTHALARGNKAHHEVGNMKKVKSAGSDENIGTYEIKATYRKRVGNADVRYVPIHKGEQGWFCPHVFTGV